MEQYAPEYNRAPHEWRLSEHITTPRKSCEGLPRQYAPPQRVAGDMSEEDDDFYPIGAVYKPYGHLYRVPSGWQGKYAIKGKMHYAPIRATPYEAALAYNAAIKAAGLDAKRLITLDDDDMEGVA